MARTYSNYGRKISKEFGKTLREWRTRPEIKLTQAQAAPKLGLAGKCPSAYLSQIENGKKPVPEEVLLNVAKVYGIPEEEVLRQAFSPQLHFPFLSAVMETHVTFDDIEDFMKELKTEFSETEKKELQHYATFLMLQRKTPN